MGISLKNAGIAIDITIDGTEGPFELVSIWVKDVWDHLLAESDMSSGFFLLLLIIRVIFCGDKFLEKDDG